MPSAGFYAVESRKIRFGRDGRWYGDDEPIENAKIALLFSRCLRRGPDGAWQIVMGEERATVEVDDTPWVVVRVEGDTAGGFTVVLNDGSREPLDTASLRAGPDHALYARVKGEHE